MDNLIKRFSDIENDMLENDHVFIDISFFMKDDQLERVFFQWMNNNNIYWTQIGSNLKRITIYRKDYGKIKRYYKEIELVKE